MVDISFWTGLLSEEDRSRATALCPVLVDFDVPTDDADASEESDTQRSDLDPAAAYLFHFCTSCVDACLVSLFSLFLAGRGFLLGCSSLLHFLYLACFVKDFLMECGRVSQPFML